MKQFQKYIFLKIGFFTQNMNFAFWRLFKDRDQSKSYTECVYKILRSFIKYF